MKMHSAQQMIEAAKIARGIPHKTCACCGDALAACDIAHDDDYRADWLVDMRKLHDAPETAPICLTCADDAPACPTCGSPSDPEGLHGEFCCADCEESDHYAAADHRHHSHHPYR